MDNLQKLSNPNGRYEMGTMIDKGRVMVVTNVKQNLSLCRDSYILRYG